MFSGPGGLIIWSQVRKWIEDAVQMTLEKEADLVTDIVLRGEDVDDLPSEKYEQPSGLRPSGLEEDDEHHMRESNPAHSPSLSGIDSTSTTKQHLCAYIEAAVAKCVESEFENACNEGMLHSVNRTPEKAQDTTGVHQSMLDGPQSKVELRQYIENAIEECLSLCLVNVIKERELHHEFTKGEVCQEINDAVEGVMNNEITTSVLQLTGDGTIE